MSGYHTHIVDNSKGSDTELAVICEGDVVYQGPHPNGRELFRLVEMLNGTEFLKYHPTDDLSIKDPKKVVYGDE